MRISNWRSDVCSSDLLVKPRLQLRRKADLLVQQDHQADEVEGRVQGRDQRQRDHRQGQGRLHGLVSVHGDQGLTVPKIVFIEQHGKEHVVDATVGKRIMQNALEIGRASCRERVWKYV